MAPCKGALNRVKSPYGEHYIVLHIPRDGALSEDSAPGLILNAAYGDFADASLKGLAYGCLPICGELDIGCGTSLKGLPYG